jgi:hypothetical protein
MCRGILEQVHESAVVLGRGTTERLADHLVFWAGQMPPSPLKIKKRARKLIQHPTEGYRQVLPTLGIWPSTRAVAWRNTPVELELAEGIEPTTARLQGGCSTN